MIFANVAHMPATCIIDGLVLAADSNVTHQVSAKHWHLPRLVKRIIRIFAACLGTDGGVSYQVQPSILGTYQVYYG